MICTIEIPGEPMSKARPRATIRAGHASVYTPSKTANYEAKVALAFKQKYPDLAPTCMPVKVEAKFIFGLNKGDYNSKGQPNKSGLRKLNGHHEKKPDLDNCLKAVTDGLNGIAYVDDSLIYRVDAEKLYSESPQVQITLTFQD